MPKTRTTLPLIALMLASPVVAQQGSVRDFQLPPAPTPTPTGTEVQGPVDSESGPVPQAPRPSPTPTQAAPTVAAPTPTAIVPAPRPTRTVPPSQPAPTRETPPQQRPAQQPTELPTAIASPPAQSEPVPAATGSPTPTATETAVPASDVLEEAEQDFQWWWLLGGLGLLVIGAGGFAFWKRRSVSDTPASTEPPKVSAWPEAKKDSPADQAPNGDAPANEASASPPAALGSSTTQSGLVFSTQPLSFSRSVMAATFAFRVTVENRARAAMGPVIIRGDLTTAHARVTPEQQLATAQSDLPEIGRVETIPAGESAEVDLQVRLPIREIRPIRQGVGAVYIPLLRLVVVDEAGKATARTHLVGQVPAVQQGRLQPFRLDEMPQGYPRLGMRPLD